jgi:hypothetical protein
LISRPRSQKFARCSKWLVCAFLATIAGCRSPAPIAESPVLAPALSASAQPASLIWSVVEGRRIRGPVRGGVDHGLDGIVIGIWSDGLVIGSEDHASGGPPFWQSRVQPSEIAHAVDEICSLMADSPDYLNVGPDSGYVRFDVDCDGALRTWGSWHPLFELNPGLVASDHGIEALNGRERDAVLKASAPEYIEFRRRWDLVVAKVTALTAAGVKSPLEGKLTYSKGKLLREE